MSNDSAHGSGLVAKTDTSNIRAVLFDRDGVLTYFDLDSATAFFRALLPISMNELGDRWQKLGTTRGFPRNIDEERVYFSDFWEQLSQEFVLTQQQRAKLASVDYTLFVIPYPEVRSVLEVLSTGTLRLGVLSNFSLASLEQSLIASGLARYFHTICAAPIIGVAKPSPRAYEIALEELQVAPEYCLFFDDEPECVAGAKRIGLRSYLVDRRLSVHDLDNHVVANLCPVPELAIRRTDQ